MSPPHPTVRLERGDIIRGLRHLITALHAMHAVATIRLVGGAAISLVHHADRGSTVDLDAELTPEDVIIAAADNIARDLGWPPDWLNSRAAQFLPSGFGERVAEWTSIYERDGVLVQVATADTLLAMKLFACQRRHRRELPDLRVLLPLCGVTTIDMAEEHLRSYYPGEELTTKSAVVVAVALADPDLHARGASVDLT